MLEAMRIQIAMKLLLCSGAFAGLVSCGKGADPRLAGSSRGPERNGWIPVRLQGAPAAIGFQHGFLLAREIDDALAVQKLSLPRETSRDWAFLRSAAERTLWPRVPDEFREEIRGIAAGMGAAGVNADVWDLVVLNSFLELSYYTDWLDRRKGSSRPDRCSAFVATGSWTRDGRPVIAHNNWSLYLEGSRWNVIFDVRPEKGHRFLMDGMPGLIHSGDDFGMNDAGVVITETTISQFHGFDPGGVPEFVRARKAMQYSESVDDFDRIMREGNNGGYANTWLVADVGRNEIARLELGLAHVTLARTKDGAFVGANFPIDPALAAEETTFPVGNRGEGRLIRGERWDRLMAEFKGRIDLAAARSFVSDHFDARDGTADSPSERTLCGHIDLSPRGSRPWLDAFGPGGTVQAKAADAAMVRAMELEAAMGHPCGIDFRAAPFLEQHPELAWQKPLLRDLPARPWTRFAAP